MNSHPAGGNFAILVRVKNFAGALLVCLAACGGSKSSEIKIAISGVAMADLEAIKTELSKIKGVSDVQAGQFKDGQVTLTLKYSGKGGELATELTSGAAALKNVKGFDDNSIQIAYGAAPPPLAPPIGTPLPLPEKKNPDPPAPPDIAKPPDPPKPPVNEPPLPPAGGKDPLAYRLQQVNQGSMATFDGWKANPVESGDPAVSFYTMVPAGRENDFQLLVVFTRPDNPNVGDIFQEGPALIRNRFGALQLMQQQIQFTLAGDPAALEEYQAENQGKKIRGRVIYLKRRDVTLMVLGLGSEAGYNEFVKAINIVAASVTMREPEISKPLIGTWGNDKDARTLTLCPNGTFLDRNGREMSFGKVTEDPRTHALSFRTDDGREWKPDGTRNGDRLVLDGVAWSKR